ncbi:MAG: enoyl-CoA hydratase/isomerase family protein [Pseudomonadota bacterium]
MSERQSDLLVERDHDLLTLTLNRPDQANALNESMVETMLETLSNAGDIRLCVIKGAGNNFCGGFDLSHIESESDGDLLRRFLRIETLLQTIHHAPFATLALAHRNIVGAGADLMAACWKRVVTQDAKIRMPGWHFQLALGTRRLAAIVGNDHARDILVDTRTVLAHEAQDIGLVTTIAATEEWEKIVADTLARTKSLPLQSLNSLLAITRTDTNTADIASIVQTAGQPGLKERILAYRSKARKS